MHCLHILIGVGVRGRLSTDELRFVLLGRRRDCSQLMDGLGFGLAHHLELFFSLGHGLQLWLDEIFEQGLCESGKGTFFALLADFI